MITKAKAFLTSDGQAHASITDAKTAELKLLVGDCPDCQSTVEAIVAKPLETIALLRLGLPRQKRGPNKKAKVSKPVQPKATPTPAKV